MYISSGSRALQGWIHVSWEVWRSNVYSLFNPQDIFDKAGPKWRMMRLVKWNEMKAKIWGNKVWERLKRWKDENEAKCPKIINTPKVHSPGFIHRDEGFRNAPLFVEESGSLVVKQDKWCHHVVEVKTAHCKMMALLNLKNLIRTYPGTFKKWI